MFGLFTQIVLRMDRCFLSILLQEDYEKKLIKLILKYLEGGEASFKHKEFVYAPVLND